MSSARGHFPARIRTPKPAAELYQHYCTEWSFRDLHISPNTLPRLHCNSIFPNNRPVEMDIGCATSDYLVAHAIQRPNTNFIGVDYSQKPLFYSIDRCATLGLENVHFFKSDIRLILPLFTPESLAGAYFHFPVPVLFHNQRKHTIFSTSFLDQIGITLTTGGFLSVMTDLADYHTKMRSMLCNDSWYTIDDDPANCASVDPAEQSYYHKMWKSYGRKVYRFLLRKR